MGEIIFSSDLLLLHNILESLDSAIKNTITNIFIFYNYAKILIKLNMIKVK